MSYIRLGNYYKVYDDGRFYIFTKGYSMYSTDGYECIIKEIKDSKERARIKGVIDGKETEDNSQISQSES